MIIYVTEYSELVAEFRYEKVVSFDSLQVKEMTHTGCQTWCPAKIK